MSGEGRAGERRAKGVREVAMGEEEGRNRKECSEINDLR